ncbi:MAG: RNA methyltransferase, partial [Bacteroidales bacterium]|nr:RNA methyltransferase [Bacteroidales bacterium]
KMVSEALASDYEVVEVYRTEEIGEEAMGRISSMNTPSPVLAVVRQKKAVSAAEVNSLIKPGMLALGLDAVRDPGNLGTIIRIADWFGIDTLFASSDTVELYNPKVVQSTMGAIFRKKVIYCDLSKVCESFAKSGMRVYGTFLDGEVLYEKELTSDGLIIMGNESNGVSPEVAAKVNSRLYIPSFAPGGATHAESLNVAVATAVTVAEFKRRTLVNGDSH